MDIFSHDGHLTDQALQGLVSGGGLSELERLELSEHLSYCDDCLLRYTELLDKTALLEPSPQCLDGLWQRIRRRMLRLLVNRYATAAAAVAIMLTALWSGSFTSGTVFPARSPEPSAFTETLRDWPEKLEESVGHYLDGLNQVFMNFGSSDITAAIKGGN